MNIYMFGHGARTAEDFFEPLEIYDIDILVDIRKKPVSRYFPHFNRKNIEEKFAKKYIWAGDWLGGSPEFHNDLLEYIKNRGENTDNSDNKLFIFIDEKEKERIFSKDLQFSNNEKRKNYITAKYLNNYIAKEQKEKAEYFLKNLFQKFPNESICFFCSETKKEHCHRYHLLENDWLKSFSDVSIKHLGEKTKTETLF